MSGDTRIIEVHVPVEAISAISQREKIGHATLHPRKMHLWWARRPLAAARAAVYATTVQAEKGPDPGEAAAYFRELCRHDASDATLAGARAAVGIAAAGKPPRVLDLFAGGGAIPLEALRLGCEATAVELNPVAHLIERCTLEFPQHFGVGLGDDLRAAGAQWVEQAWSRVGHLYPQVRDTRKSRQLELVSDDTDASRVAGRPLAYLWTRTVPCPNPEREPHEVPLVRQTWLARKKGRHIALRPRVDRKRLTVEWQVVEASTPEELGFDPAGFSKRGSTSCLACGAAVDATYVKAQGLAGRMGITPLAAVTLKANGRGRDYLAAGTYLDPDVEACEAVLAGLEVQPPEEFMTQDGGRWFQPPLYGLTRFRNLFTPRQLATLCALAQGVPEIHEELVAAGMEADRAAAVATYLAMALDRVVDRSSNLCRWETKNETMMNTYARQALPMVWDFGETNPFGPAAGQASEYVDNVAHIVEVLAKSGRPATVLRTSATNVPFPDESFDAVVTDPPYYDNISYADLSDFFYVWLKRSVGFLYPDELGGELTPKRREAIVAPYRFDGSKVAAREFYEQEMATAFAEAHRVLKPGAPLVCVYAHKTTLGWASLVEALRSAGFMITEAWPLDTEMPERSTGQGTASLASSIFLVARRRDGAEVGDATTVRRELESVIQKRLEDLVAAGVTGSDLIIAAIGAALQPFTRYARVELPNGEPLPADRFLEEVQSRVLSAILRTVHGLGEGMGGLDPATRYYVLWRYSFGIAAVDFDEANNLARTTGVELMDELVSGQQPLAERSGRSIRLLDFTERGDDPELGLNSLRLVDALHGLLWRAAHHPIDIQAYLDAARPDARRLRAVAQSLQGRALRDEGESKPVEAQACERLLGSWRTLVEDNLFAA